VVKFHRRIFGLIFVSFDRNYSPQFCRRFLGGSGSGSMSLLEEVLDQLWLHATFEEDPWTGYGPFAAIRDGGKVAIDGLAWAPREDDVNLKKLVLQLLHEHYARVKRVVPPMRRCIRAEDRLVRATAINTCGVMSDTSKELPRANPPFLPRTASASHHLR
jgi:hypothetical protein